MGKIKIGDNNTINKSSIRIDEHKEQKTKFWSVLVIPLFVTIVGGIVVAVISQLI